jgi:murein L,D-transpeptidase YcbB/YkuD
MIWLINNAEQSNKGPLYTSPSSPQSYNYLQSSSTPAAQAPSAPQSSESPDPLLTILRQRDASTPDILQSSKLQYTKPSVGNNNVLSVLEIRWCIREGIRIEVMRDIIDNNKGIDEFNRIIDDYNIRCGNYRYRQGSQSRAEHDIQPYRSQIALEAIRDARVLGRSHQPSYPSVSPRASTSSSKKPSTQYTREAQQLLADLGYDPGLADGQYGGRTAGAVKAFQRDVGIKQDGWIDQDLISALKTIKEVQRKNSD